jgi:hypothetical protein
MAFGPVTTLFYFAWLLSYPTGGGGVDVDGLACRLHRPMTYE